MLPARICDPQIKIEEIPNLSQLEAITGGQTTLAQSINNPPVNVDPTFFIDVYWDEARMPSFPCQSTISYGSCNCIGQSIGIYRNILTHANDPTIPLGVVRLTNVTLGIKPYDETYETDASLLDSWRLKRDQTVIIGDPALHLFWARNVSGIMSLDENTRAMVNSRTDLDTQFAFVPAGTRVIVWNGGSPTLWVRGDNLEWRAAGAVLPQASTVVNGVAMLTTIANGRIAYGKGDSTLENMVTLEAINRENVALNPSTSTSQVIWQYQIPSTISRNSEILVTTSFEGVFDIGASSWVDFKHRLGTDEAARRVSTVNPGFTSFTSKFSSLSGGTLMCVAEFSGSNFSTFNLNHVSSSITIKQNLL